MTSAQQEQKRKRRGERQHHDDRKIVGHSRNVGFGPIARIASRMVGNTRSHDRRKQRDADTSGQLLDTVRYARRSSHLVLIQVPKRESVQRREGQSHAESPQIDDGHDSGMGRANRKPAGQEKAQRHHGDAGEHERQRADIASKNARTPSSI